MQTVYETKPSVTEDDITTIFNEIDRDRNGFITPREARRAYKKITERFNIEKVIPLIGISPTQIILRSMLTMIFCNMMLTMLILFIVLVSD